MVHCELCDTTELSGRDKHYKKHSMEHTKTIQTNLLLYFGNDNNIKPQSAKRKAMVNLGPNKKQRTDTTKTPYTTQHFEMSKEHLYYDQIIPKTCLCTFGSLKVKINKGGDKQYGEWQTASQCLTELKRGYSIKEIKILSIGKLRKIAQLHGYRRSHGNGKRACRDYLGLHPLADVNMDLLSRSEIKQRMAMVNSMESGQENRE